MRALLTSHEGVYGIQSAIRLLQSGSSVLDALEAGARDVELDVRATTVGIGGAPNILGEMEFDAAVMDGDTLDVACIGAISNVEHPISVARKLLGAMPHVMLVGEGAERFARESGFEMADTFTDASRRKWDSWRSATLSPAHQKELTDDTKLAPYISFETRSDLSKGTVTFLGIDHNGTMAGAVTTSGWAYKYPGRLGDSPIIGAGLYVDSRYGGASCTHTGEMTIRLGTARSVVLYMQKGASVVDACHEAANDLRYLKTGYLGPVIIHALSPAGETCVVSTGGDDGDSYYVWREGDESFERKTPDCAAAFK